MSFRLFNRGLIYLCDGKTLFLFLFFEMHWKHLFISRLTRAKIVSFKTCNVVSSNPFIDLLSVVPGAIFFQKKDFRPKRSPQRFHRRFRSLYENLNLWLCFFFIFHWFDFMLVNIFPLKNQSQLSPKIKIFM
jgi:hypothetical protein